MDLLGPLFICSVILVENKFLKVSCIFFFFVAERMQIFDPSELCALPLGVAGKT